MSKLLFIYLTFLIPITIFIIIIWRLYRKQKIMKFSGIIWLTFMLLLFVAIIAEKLMKPVIIRNSDICGEYIIDRTKFKGKQAEWQYKNFRFKITENEELIFESHIYGDEWKIEKLNISYSSGYFDEEKNEYCNRKIRIHSDLTNHHIIKDNPTLYRESFNFYYVFKSEKFGNVFFKKGIWKLEK